MLTSFVCLQPCHGVFTLPDDHSTPSSSNAHAKRRSTILLPTQGERIPEALPPVGGVQMPQMPKKSAVPELSSEEKMAQQLSKRVGLLAGHMTHQASLHEQAVANTKGIFGDLLNDLDVVCQAFKSNFKSRSMETHRIYSEVDPDRSIGVLNVMWHCLSFTSRGNHKPLAIARGGKEPLFTGRILAIRGDFHDLAHSYETFDFTDLLPFELASLYIPADPLEPAIIRIPHLGGEEEYIDQASAGRTFLMKTVEMVCSGGFLHEQ
jgi:hypothetical protein